jgi:phenylalanyl-tRNA synthetase alpha subunit
MPTNRFVESSFWNFDSLFQPQAHPSRDMHDTFFIKQAPDTPIKAPADYIARVKEIHEHGGFGSIGYGAEWKAEEGAKTVLRTHTTAVSARMLYELAQQVCTYIDILIFIFDDSYHSIFLFHFIFYSLVDLHLFVIFLLIVYFVMKH